MNLALWILLFVSAVELSSFYLSYKLEFNGNFDPKIKAKVATVAVIALFCYVCILVSIAFWGLLIKNYLAFFLLLFAIIPFVIGYYVQYNTLKKYSMLQIISYVLSMYYVVCVLM